MTKTVLIKKLEHMDDDKCVVIVNRDTLGWSNVVDVVEAHGVIEVFIDDGLVFSDE